MDHTIQMCSLGMFIIDEIDYLGSKQRQASLIGGAGTYAAVGARLVVGEANARSVGWIVDMGSDFPPEFRTTLEAWQTSFIFREDMTRLTTRGWNGYGPNEYRGESDKRVAPAFKYMTPKKRLDQDDLPPSLLMANSFHFVCSPERCITLVHSILNKRKELESQNQGSTQQPVLVWEPVPDLCTPEEAEKMRKAIRLVDIVSPNADELASFFATDGTAPSQSEMVDKIISWGIGHEGQGVLVVREGSKGCSSYSRKCQLQLKAYHAPDAESQSRVIDPTGGGNAFLGALAIGIRGDLHPPINSLENKLAGHQQADWEQAIKLWSPYKQLPCALIYASVAASFVIEQAGMPLISDRVSGEISWNGDLFEDRIAAYVDRERDHIVGQLSEVKMKVTEQT